MKYDNVLFPSTVVIEPTNICNLSCTMCQASCSVRPITEQKNVTPEQLRIVLDKLKGYIVNLVFQGDCEPTMNPHLPELVRMASEYTEEVCMVTNGTLLTKELSHTLANSGLSFFSISVDDHRAERYDSIRIGAEQDQVLENLRHLIELRDNGNPQIRILIHKVVFPEDTIEDLKEFIAFFRDEYPVNKVTFAPLIDGNAQVAINNWILLRNQLEIELMNEGKYMNLHDYENYPYRTEHKYYCGTNLFFVTHNGNLKPCPLHSGSFRQFGNLLEESLEEIASKDLYTEHHRYWLEKRFDAPVPAICEECYVLFNPYFYYCLDDGSNAINVFLK